MDDQLIKKRIIQAGKGEVPKYSNDTKVKFHYVTRTVNDEPVVIDDSRKHKQPMELIIGKKFKFEVWEECIKSMACYELSSFIVDKKLTVTYPIVAKGLRSIFLKSSNGEQESHCCGMAALGEQGLGHDDLNKLMNDPQPLEFILEILEVNLPGNYEKDAWAMTSDEKVTVIPSLKAEGNALYSKGDYHKASEKYAQALGLLERLSMQEKPGSPEQKEIDLQKIPYLLNYSQCQLLLENFYEVIKHTSEVLSLNPNNVKALYRRAKAEVKVWRTDEARGDFEAARKLDPSLANNIQSEIKILDNLIKQKNADDRAKLKGKLFS